VTPVRPDAPVALTLGDPDGIGPEISARAWNALRADGPGLVLYGREDIARRACALAGAPEPILGRPEEVCAHAPVLVPVDTRLDGAASAIAALELALADARAGAVCALATAPISKARAYAAGFRHPGHTEFLADAVADLPFTGPRGPVMMLAAPGLRTVLVSIHESLRAAIDALSVERITATAHVTHDALRRDFGIDRPRLALAGLNPHAGEGGALGREEIDIVIPAAEALRADGLDVSGPHAPDSLFHADARAGYDAAICLYHDQGLIPVKTLDIHGGVNITLGLPIVRASPDHGTADAIAWKGVARAESLSAAIRAAAETAARRAAFEAAS
jgi:4-hydroxythreonine-4-phosphate dehydrogenase